MKSMKPLRATKTRRARADEYFRTYTVAQLRDMLEQLTSATSGGERIQELRLGHWLGRWRCYMGAAQAVTFAVREVLGYEIPLARVRVSAETGEIAVHLLETARRAGRLAYLGR